MTSRRWLDGSPVELAFIDVCKTHELNAHVARQFYPSLIAGGSTLIHQDFFYDRLPWIRVTMGYLADYFRWEGQVAGSSVFTTVKAVPEDVAAYDPFTEATLEECLAHHDAVAFPGIDRTAQLMLALSRVHLILHKGSRDQALEQLTETAVEYVDILGATSQADSYEPPPGSPETMLPRYRMDRAVTEVLKGAGGKAAKGSGGGSSKRRAAGRARPGEGRPEQRDWDEARQILEPLRAAEPRGPRRSCSRAPSSTPGIPTSPPTCSTSSWPDAAGTSGPARCGPGSIWSPATSSGRGPTPRRHCGSRPGLIAARRVLFDLAVAERLGATT